MPRRTLRVLKGVNMEVSQLEPGPLAGHHLRVSVPGGEMSWAVTNLPLRASGCFPAGAWTLSVIAGTASRGQQHGVEVRSGSLFYHRPGAPHDGLYGREFSVICMCVAEQVFTDTVREEFPELWDGLDRPWRTYEPSEERRAELVDQFTQAVTILRTDANVRRSIAATAVMQDELLAVFLEAVAESTAPATIPAVSQAAALVRRAEELAHASSAADNGPLRVTDSVAGLRRAAAHLEPRVPASARHGPHDVPAPPAPERGAAHVAPPSRHARLTQRDRGGPRPWLLAPGTIQRAIPGAVRCAPARAHVVAGRGRVTVPRVPACRVPNGWVPSSRDC